MQRRPKVKTGNPMALGILWHMPTVFKTQPLDNAL
jgi:hypothetical protein